MARSEHKQLTFVDVANITNEKYDTDFSANDINLFVREYYNEVVNILEDEGNEPDILKIMGLGKIVKRPAVLEKIKRIKKLNSNSLV